MGELKHDIHESSKLRLVRKVTIHEAAKIGRERVTVAEKENAYHASVRQMAEENRKIREQWRIVGIQAAFSAGLREVRRSLDKSVFREAASKTMERTSVHQVDVQLVSVGQKRSVGLVFAVVVALLALVVAIIQA
jgi:hypothetical protein